MTDNRTTELREKLAERGIEYTTDDGEHVKSTCWSYMGELMAEFAEFDNGTTLFACDNWCFTPDQAIAATIGSDRDEIYNAGFDNGVKACLQILDGYLEYPHSAAENIQKWVDEQWEEYGA